MKRWTRSDDLTLYRVIALHRFCLQHFLAPHSHRDIALLPSTRCVIALSSLFKRHHVIARHHFCHRFIAPSLHHVIVWDIGQASLLCRPIVIASSLYCPLRIAPSLRRHRAIALLSSHHCAIAPSSSLQRHCSITIAAWLRRYIAITSSLYCHPCRNHHRFNVIALVFSYCLRKQVDEPTTR